MYYVYIMSSRTGVLYTGVTSNLLRRVHLHRNGIGSRFTARYRVNRLVYFEGHEDMIAAIEREKSLKGKSRRKKMELIRQMNPRGRDLAEDLGF